MKIRTATFLLLPAFFLAFCHKGPGDQSPVPITVTNTWECTVNGVSYSGTIDTSFLEISRYVNSVDTILYCTGTSLDKKANIHFRFSMNRSYSSSDSVSTDVGNEFDFDTTTSTALRAWSTLGNITVHIEGFDGHKFKGRFAGTAMGIYGGGLRTVSNGTFSFDVGKGSNEPKFLSCSADNTTIRGYAADAQFISNTLVIDGIGFHGDSTWQLMVRTGSSLKTGVFKSSDGNVGFQAYRPSVVTHYVSDVAGDLTVNIESVNGNVVEGSFSGSSQGTYTGSQVNIGSGRFRCRVRNYVAQADSVNKWGFSESNDLQYPYHTWSGNILNATRYSSSGMYYLVVNGESDNGASKFKIKLRSVNPIAPGIYQTGSNYPNNADSVYFSSAPMNAIYFQTFSSELACQLDTVTNERVVGRFYGKAYLMNSGNTGIYFGRAVRRGFFKANF